jgi:predicted dehydrogenase
MSQFKGVLAGLGNHGRYWNGICHEQPEVELVGYVARTERSRERAAKEWGVPRERLFASLQEAFDQTLPDFVLDVTPPEAHREVALTSFASGLPVLGEKPMSDSFQSAREIVEAEEKAGCLHMIAQQKRFEPQPRLTRSLLEENVIGRPGQLDIAFYVPWADLPGTHYVRDPFMFLLDMGCHHFDMMRYVLGAEPQSVQVVSWNLPCGFKAIHRAMGCSVGKKTPWTGNWRIEGPAGSLTWEDDRIFVTQEHRTDKPRREEVPVELFVPERVKTAVLEEFLAALKEGREPECSGPDNLKTMAMTFAALKSAREGRRVNLSELR